MKEIQTRRQRALIVSLGGDQESDEFYPPSGGGYATFVSGAATGDCPNPFREGCTEDAHGAAWTALFAGKFTIRNAHLSGDCLRVLIISSFLLATQAVQRNSWLML